MATTPPKSITTQLVFEVQESDCPTEVKNEVKRLRKDVEFGNDNFYYSWDTHENEEDAIKYPIIYEYLQSKAINKCLIHW